MNTSDRESVIYRDPRYILALRSGEAYITIDGAGYQLTCHPYEPCTYIRDESGALISVIHNAFDPSYVLEAFARGEGVISISGREYAPRDFCELLECAVRYYHEANIDSVESQAFPERMFKNDPAVADESALARFGHTEPPHDNDARELADDPFYDLIARYPDLVTDYRLIKSKDPYKGESSHREALEAAMRAFAIRDSDDAEPYWKYDISKANPQEIPAGELLYMPDNATQAAAEVRSHGEDIPYWYAFLFPPYGRIYTDEDFLCVNKALFPNGTADLKVYRWTTDWTDYFDEGHEWWGALCITVYDKSLDRFTVICASASD